MKVGVGTLVMDMKIIRAEHLGMCFGVRDAIALAERESSAAPLTILGELVHNETVIAGLRARGITIQNDVGGVATQKVMITAHGASQRVLEQVRGRGLNVVEATCPLVHVAHRAVAELVRTGFHPVIIGRRDHVEVRGLTGDLEDFDVVLEEADVLGLRERPRFGVAAQTTQPVDKVERLVELIRRRFPAEAAHPMRRPLRTEVQCGWVPCAWVNSTESARRPRRFHGIARRAAMAQARR